MENAKLLSLCIPTYNRCKLLEEQIIRLTSLPLEVLDQIEIIISDNCSDDETEQIVENYISKGFNCKYFKNPYNLGMDGNFVSCFRKATGKYVWLLGDDDIIIEKGFEELLRFIREGDYGLVHISQKNEENKSYVIYHDDELFCREISYWSTFISANIVRTKYVSYVDFDKYMGTWFTLMPLYIMSLHNEPLNSVVYYKVFGAPRDGKRNGGYNLFEVFVENYLSIWKESLEKGIINNFTYEFLKKDLYKEKLVGCIIFYLILKRESNFTLDRAWSILYKNYGNRPYAYTEIIKSLVKGAISKLFNW